MTQHIWGEGVKVFISHATSTRPLAGEVKALFADMGISVFVAHEDIKPAEQWPEVILDALASMDVFLAILSGDFKKSDYCDQEVGFAIAERERKRKLRGYYGGYGNYEDRPVIMSLMHGDDIKPYGFLSNEQAAKFRQAADIPSKVLDVLFEKDFDHWFESFTYRIRCSPNYATSNDKLAPELERIERLTSEQAQALVDAVNSNNQVYKAWGFMPVIERTVVQCPDIGQISFYYEPTSPYNPNPNPIQFRIDRDDGDEDSSPW